MKLTKLFLVSVLLLAVPLAKASYWRNSVAPFFWFGNPSFESDNQELLAPNFSDYFEELELNLGTKLTFDHLTYGVIGSAFHQKSAFATNTYLDVAVYRKHDYAPNLKALAGFRHHNISLLGFREEWFDVYFGGLGNLSLGDNSELEARVDLGASLAYSKPNWNAQIEYRRSVSEDFNVSLGYRFLLSHFESSNVNQQWRDSGIILSFSFKL